MHVESRVSSKGVLRLPQTVAVCVCGGGGEVSAGDLVKAGNRTVSKLLCAGSQGDSGKRYGIAGLNVPHTSLPGCLS